MREKIFSKKEDRYELNLKGKKIWRTSVSKDGIATLPKNFPKKLEEAWGE